VRDAARARPSGAAILPSTARRSSARGRRLADLPLSSAAGTDPGGTCYRVGTRRPCS
jgi:hypothetical protein